jgi:hypothetical protein
MPSTSKSKNIQLSGRTKSAEDANRQGGQGGFLSGIPDYIKAITAVLLTIPPLIGAVYGVLAVVHIKRPPGPVQKPKTPITEQTEAKAYIDQYECLKVEPKYTHVMPLMLANAIGVTAFPYWFRLNVDNECGEPISVRVSWHISQRPLKPMIRFGEESGDPLTILPKRDGYKNYDLKLQLISNDFPQKMDLTVEWTLLNEQLRIPKPTQSFEITLLPPDVYVWDLVAPTGDEVPKEFVFAALTNWVTTPSDTKENTVERLSTSLGNNTEVENWVRQAYSELFGDSKAVQVIQGGDNFPPESFRRILTPEQVLRRRSGDALEVALTIAAVTYDATLRGAKTILVVAPADPPFSGHKTFLFGWETDRDVWKAIDVSKVNSQSFEVNKEQASPRLNQLMTAIPLLRSGVAKQGVFVSTDAATLGLNFRMVHLKPEYRIRNLPIASSSLVAAVQDLK